MNETLPQELSHDFLCVDLEVSTRLFQGYVNGTLTDEDRTEFEDHLRLCFKCWEDLVAQKGEKAFTDYFNSSQSTEIKKTCVA